LFIHAEQAPVGHSKQQVLHRPVEPSQYTSWIFEHRLRSAGLLGSMGQVASSVDNTMMESF
jgi:transposase InsO family protein